MSEPVLGMLLDKMEVVFRSDTPEYVASGGRVFRDTAVVARKPAHPQPLSLSHEGADGIGVQGEGTVIEGQFNATRPASKRYFLIWTTPEDSFGPLRWLVLDKLFAKVRGWGVRLCSARDGVDVVLMVMRGCIRFCHIESSLYSSSL